MDTEQHLELIVKFCERNLEIAEKRTQGEWYADNRSGCCAVYPLARIGDSPGLHRDDDRIIHYSSKGHEFLVRSEGSYHTMSEKAQMDNEFIATCAGAAEAGWKATIAAVDMVATCGFMKSPLAAIILAAYPIELIMK